MKTDLEFLQLAQSAVPDHLKPLGKVIRNPSEVKIAALGGGGGSAADDPLAKALAKEVGAELPPPDDDAADVEFLEHSPLGPRSTIVQIRRGKVARTIKRA